MKQKKPLTRKEKKAIFKTADRFRRLRAEKVRQEKAMALNKEFGEEGGDYDEAN